MTKKRRRQQNGKRKRNNPPNFLGQHLMHNKKILTDIVKLAKIKQDEIVVELGGGKGALTELLAQTAGKLIVVEYDSKFVKILKKKMNDNPAVTIIQQDILQFQLPRKKFVVVANIPFAITTPIMKKLLIQPNNHFHRGVLLIEKGAAKRFTSSFVKDPYVMAWRMWFDIRYEKFVSRRNFSPPPRVDTAIISIQRKVQPLVPVHHYYRFYGLLEYGMKNPHLSIDIALRGIFTVPQIKHLRRNLKVPVDLPVGMLTEQHWGTIFTSMLKHVPSYRWPRLSKKKM